MAMNGAQLGAEITAAVLDSNATPEAQDIILANWTKIATAIVSHIQKNGEVLPGIPVVTAGTAAAQTGATTAPGKVG